MPTPKKFASRPQPVSIAIMAWQAELLKHLAHESDRNVSSIARRVISAGLIYMGHEETVRKHDPVYRQTASETAQELQAKDRLR